MLLKWMTQIQAIAQNGLTYCKDKFDKERYTQLMHIASEMGETASKNLNQSEIFQYFSVEEGYATPKIDVRVFIMEDEKVLLVKERSDNRWTLPGGWADMYESPSEVAIKEAKEETGYTISIVRFLALWDKLKHDHPPEWPHAYKCIFQCKIEGGVPTENMEISEIAFFPFNDLPELSTNRITKNQILRLREMVLQHSNVSVD